MNIAAISLSLFSVLLPLAVEGSQQPAVATQSAVQAAVQATEAPAAAPGRREGSGFIRTQVQAHGTDQYEIVFKADELATIRVSGDGDTDLDLHVYDENGNLIASDIDSTDECYVSWAPRWTGEFTVEVVNLGRVYNEYTLRTN